MFLDKIVNKVYEIEYASIIEYNGNYTAFEKQKRENYEKQLKDYEYQQKEIKRLRGIYERFRYKPSKASLAMSRLHQLEKMDILEKLDKGLIDFGIFLDPIDKTKYNFLKIPTIDTLGILARKDSSLAKKNYVTNKDLIDKPLIISRQTNEDSRIMRWLNTTPDKLNIVATYNLAFNASLMVDEGLGYALVLDKIINTSENSDLCFIPLKPDMKVEMYIMWKKYQIFSKATEEFLNVLKNERKD